MNIAKVPLDSSFFPIIPLFLLTSLLNGQNRNVPLNDLYLHWCQKCYRFSVVYRMQCVVQCVVLSGEAADCNQLKSPLTPHLPFILCRSLYWPVRCQ